jgi:hypothetical protein
VKGGPVTDRAGIKTEAACEVLVDLEIFFGSLKTNGMGSNGFEELEDE